VFVLPSVRESHGTVYFEAMSMRVPVVGMRGEGIAEYVTDRVDGFLIGPGDMGALVRIMLEMHAHRERRREVAERGYALFDRSGVRWRDYVAAHLALYERVLPDAQK
jgi:glycosyltransferase involved in cell wall biosynthesis